MIEFENFQHSEVRGDRVLFRLVASDNKTYEFSISHVLAGVMAAAIQAASKHLPEYQGPAIVPAGFRPVVCPDMTPGLMLDFGGNLAIVASLPPNKLADLRSAIDGVEAMASPDSPPH